MPTTQQQAANEVIKLQEIIDALPSNTGHETERREYSLTKGDVILIYRIAKIASTPHICPFEGEEGVVLHTVAKSINSTQRIAFRVIVTAVLTGIVAGLWYGIGHVVRDYIVSGGHIK